jgi:hypothetical protein
MNSISLKWAVPALGGLGISIWALLLYVKGINVPFTVEAAKEVPNATGYVTFVSIIFSQWLWKIPWLQGWLVTVPNLNGTWEGDLVSTWKDPQTGKSPGPIKVFLVVRQSLFKMSCVLMTKESKSWSRAVSIQTAPDGALKVLEFTYSNSPKPTVQHRSKAHDGACSLEVIANKTPKLTGKYWTERATTGEMDLKFKNRRHRQSFDG